MVRSGHRGARVGRGEGGDGVKGQLAARESVMLAVALNARADQANSRLAKFFSITKITECMN